MLRELVVEDVGVIERAELALDPGSSALTGETGAGKTLLVSAMALVLGDRADRTLVRSGASEARVEARFQLDPEHPAAVLLRERGLLEDGDEDVVVTRAVSEGGGKVRINGRLATVSLLAEIGPLLVEIAGQHEHQLLGSRKEQTRLLDEFAGPEALALAAEVAERVRSAVASRRRAEESIGGQRELERELDVLRHEIAEISDAGVRPGESEELRVTATRLEHSEAIAAALGRARGALETEGGAVERTRDAAREAERVVDRDPDLQPLVQRLESAAIELDDVARELGERLPTEDEGVLDELRDRLATLSRLQRKYGDDDTDVLAYLESARLRAIEIESGSFDAERVQRQAAEDERVALSCAAKLSALRRDAAPRLAAEVERLLASLAMADTAVQVALEPTDLHEGGLEKVELRIASPGHDPRPISKIASGGELARLSLALRLAAGGRSGSARTLIFDEVDSGVGGEAARTVGRCLSDLARGSAAQVLVVTHLPQVAAFADAHHRVKKVTSGSGAAAVVEKLERDERVAELSRMLAGLPGSELAREHAQELLEIAAAS